MNTAQKVIDFIMEVFKSYIRWFRFAKKFAVQIKNLLDKKAVKVIGTIFKYVFTTLWILILFLGVVSQFPVFGDYRSLVVLSGSMEPVIAVGSVIITRPPDSIQKGDIVTFKNPNSPEDLVTHRITEINNNQLTTKGDANQSADNWTVPTADVVGKKLVSIPYLGYAVNFAKSRRGFVLMVILPAMLIIIEEMRTIKNEIEKKYKQKYEGSGRDKKTIIAAAVFIVGALSACAGSTAAFLSDTEKSTGNVLSAGAWDYINITEFMPNPDAVSDANGEWFEIYNGSSGDEDLYDWWIGDDGADSHTIDESLVLGAHDYLVLCRNEERGENGDFECDYEYSGFILGNDTDEIVIKNADGEEVVRVNYNETDHPYEAGYSAQLKERMDDVTDPTSWEKADDTEIYGDGDHGTPGEDN